MNDFYQNLDRDYLLFCNKKIYVIIDVNKKVWFNLKDVLTALGIKNQRDVIRNYVDKRHLRAKSSINVSKDTVGQPAMTYISESGLYKLMGKSRNKIAEIFTDWVYDDVLPAIRMYGEYKVKKNTDAEILDLHSQINYLAKDKRQLEINQKKNKYPNGGLVYVADYSTKRKKIYRIGRTKNLKGRKCVYDTHTEKKHEFVFWEICSYPQPLEACTRSGLHMYTPDGRDFYYCDLEIIINKIKECVGVIGGCENQIGGGILFLESEMTRMQTRVDVLQRKSDKIANKLAKEINETRLATGMSARGFTDLISFYS